MKIAGLDLSKFSIRIVEQNERFLYAASQLQFYVSRAIDTYLEITKKEEKNQIVLNVGYDGKDDGFKVECKNGNLYLTGESERGLLYAVYDVLERFIGWRFFAGEMTFKGVETGKYMDKVEKLFSPEKEEMQEGESYEENPVILFRDFFGHAGMSEDWCAKNRINGDIWMLKNMPSHMGGAERFASQGGHSFDELLPEGRYYEKHPEYYALVKGKRMAGWNGQPCMTNDEVVLEMSENAKAIMRRKPTARYISVSQNDNNNFCTCEKCVELEKEIGKGGVLFRFVNKIAKNIEEEFPKVKVHTYAYDATARTSKEPLRKNVLPQYCLQYCHRHTLNDPTCKGNVGVAKRIKALSDKCEEIFIYDYRSSEAHILQFMPDLYQFRENMKFLADHKVTGIYAETDIFCQNSPCMEELRGYVTAKLMWDPYMSDEEFRKHIDEFLQGYYGEGWKHIRRFIELWEENSRLHFNATLGNVGGDDGRDIIGEDGIPVRCLFTEKEKINEFCAELETELDKAYALANEEEKHRIKMLRAGTLWYRLFHTMDEILEHGTPEAKAKAIADNRELCSIMRRYCMKYTCFIAMTETTEMYKDFTLPPSQWKYWQRTSNRIIFNELADVDYERNEADVIEDK